MEKYEQDNRRMQKTIILLLILFISGLPQLGTTALAQNAQAAKTSVRHLAPAPSAQNGMFNIEAFIEGNEDIDKVFLWSRLKGARRFQKTEMHRIEKHHYKAALSKSEQGIEYYIEVLDTNGLQQNDGSANKPYFFQSAAPAPSPPFQFSTALSETGLKKPFWKKTWFWVAVVAVVGGGVALAGGGGDKGQNTGTVVVD